MKPMKKSAKSCEKCDSINLKTHQTTYPVKIGKKQLNVQRVSVKECMDCHDLKPTKAGQEKVARCIMTFMSLYEGDNFSLV